MKHNPGELKVLHPGSTATSRAGADGLTGVVQPADDEDMVSLRSQALRTPLDTMAIFADLAASSDVTDEQRQIYATRLKRESRSLSALIDNALELQRLETGRQDLDLGPVDVHAIIRRAVLAAGEDERRPIGIPDPEPLPLVWADAEAVLEVMANFLENARRFSLGSGTIAIEARQIGGVVEISIQDHGIGLEAAELPKIFLKFYRAGHGLRLRSPGAGLGLAINRRIVESHGGRVSASSGGPGKGACFRFSLPVAPDLKNSDYVLIVDGDASFARLLKTELASVGLETLRASDAESAQKLLMDTAPRAIVLDLRFADALARQQLNRDAHIPFVVLAAEDVLAGERSVLEGWDVVGVLPKEAGAPQATAALIAEALMP